MADENLLVSHGEPQWDVKYNKLVNVVKNMGGVVDNLQLTESTNEGIVLLNSTRFDVSDSATYYRLLKLKNATLVVFRAQLMLENVADKTYALPVAKVPDSIRPIADINAIEPGGVSKDSATFPLYLYLTYGGTLNISSSIPLTSGMGLNGTFVYVANN